MGDPDLFKSALRRAMAICAGSEHSGGEIAGKLSSWGVSAEDAGEIIRVLAKENFVNDKRYAAAYISDKLRYNKWGKVKIAAQLKIKGIPDDIIRESLNAVDDSQYLNMIKEVLASHRKSLKAKNQYDLKGKMMRFGLSRGYESHLLYDLLNDLD